MQNTIDHNKKKNGLFHCTSSCKYHKTGYVIECKSFKFGRYFQFEWTYNRFFTCNSKNVLYLLQCKHCWKFYIGETGDLKERTRLHKSNVLHPHNSNCRKLSEHLRSCSSLTEPYFVIYPLYYVEDQQRRRFIEKRFIKLYKPPLNSDT